MREIPLTQGKIAIIDDEDFDYINQWKWHYSNWGYATRNSLGSHKNRKTISMHRVIMHTPEGLETDYINHDGLDNRKCNLRICTHYQNMANELIHCDNKSGFRGVSWDKGHKKWTAFITSNNKKTYLGLFINIENAAEAYNEKAKELFGEFAN